MKIIYLICYLPYLGALLFGGGVLWLWLMMACPLGKFGVGAGVLTAELPPLPPPPPFLLLLLIMLLALLLLVVLVEAVEPPQPPPPPCWFCCCADDILRPCWLKWRENTHAHTHNCARSVVSVKNRAFFFATPWIYHKYTRTTTYNKKQNLKTK